jgi:hypothetical protein
MSPHIVSDGAGGAIVVSETYTVKPVLRAQRVDRHGNILWDRSLRGIKVSTAGDEQWNPVVVSDGAGGAYIGFDAMYIVGRYLEPPEPKYNRRAIIQRLDAQGNLLFGDKGLSLRDYPLDSTKEGGAMCSSSCS